MCEEHEARIPVRVVVKMAEQFVLRALLLVVCGTTLVLIPATADFIRGRLFHRHKLMLELFLRKPRLEDSDTQVLASEASWVHTATILWVRAHIFDAMN